MTCLSVSQAPVHSGNHIPNVSIARILDHSVMVRPAKYIALSADTCIRMYYQLTGSVMSNVYSPPVPSCNIRMKI